MTAHGSRSPSPDSHEPEGGLRPFPGLRSDGSAHAGDAPAPPTASDAPDDDAAPHVNGELTLGENIGDLGGLSIAYKAWKRAQEKRPTPDTESIDGYTPAQRLFISWGYVWQEKSRDEALRTRIATDPHSPAEFRAGQTPRNVDAFYEAFDVTEGDGRWLPEEERVTIW